MSLLKQKAEIVGILSFFSKRVHRFLPYETQLIDCLVNQLGTALENAQIYEAMERSQRQLQSLAEKLQLAREEERARLARRLHDEMGQALAALKMKLDDYTAESLNDPDQQREYEKTAFWHDRLHGQELAPHGQRPASADAQRYGYRRGDPTVCARV